MSFGDNFTKAFEAGPMGQIGKLIGEAYFPGKEPAKPKSLVSAPAPAAPVSADTPGRHKTLLGV